MSKTTLLQGPPGSGKTTMACLTPPRKPVHVVDIDRKVSGMAALQPNIKSGELTYWELGETLAEESLASRAIRLAKNEKPERQPQGWISIAKLIEKLPTDEVSKKAQTWVIDSFSIAADHLIRLILFSSQRGTGQMNIREWGAFLQMCKETVTVLRDEALANDKDLIVLVHERMNEVPRPTTRIIYDGDNERKFVGEVDWRISTSIPGQFGLEMPKHFEEVYALDVKIVNNKPTWVCRVQPDEKRYLRTSFDTKGRTEFSPNFAEIWK